MAEIPGFSYQWSSSTEEWVGQLSHPLFGRLSLAVITDGQHQEPDSKQLSVVKALLELDASMKQDLRAATKAYVEKQSGLPGVNAFYEDDFELELDSGGTVPQEYENGKCYAILHAGTEVEPEHGLSVVFDAQGNFGIADADICFSPPHPDEFEIMERIIDVLD